MNIVVDTSVWSLALRRRRSSPSIEAMELAELVREGRAAMLGPVNRCRAKGIQGSNTDFLICAAAVRRGFGILTTDADFVRFARVLPIELHTPRASVTG